MGIGRRTYRRTHGELPAFDSHTGRRAFMGTLAGGLLAYWALRAGVVRGSEGPLLVGCRMDGSGQNFASGLDASGHPRFDVPIPGRGHAVAFRPDAPEVVVFARRPGTFAVVIDIEQGIALVRLDAAPDRHFYGHGAFSADGRLLFTTENDYATGQGMIGIRDATAGYREIGSFPSHGIGPHEVILMPDGTTLAIANGGIRTHPDTGRAKLNLDSMAPSLAYADLASGRALDDFHLAQRLHQNSIRHVTADGSGRVGIAMQYEGPKSHRVPLVGVHDQDGLRLFAPPEAIERRMRHYAGAITFDAGATMLGASHPRGNLITFWDAASGDLLWHADVADSCGIAAGAADGVFVVSSGEGEIIELDVPARRRTVLAGAACAWDNHLVPHRT